MIPPELVDDALEKLMEDIALCVRDSRDMNLTSEARCVAHKMAMAYRAALITAKVSFKAIGPLRGEVLTYHDDTHETKHTPIISMSALDLVELSEQSTRDVKSPGEFVHIVQLHGEVFAFLCRDDGEANVEVFRSKK